MIELITFTFWIILFSRAVFANNTHEAVIGTILLVIAIVFGISLIRSVLHEMEQREKIGELEEELRVAYERKGV